MELTVYNPQKDRLETINIEFTDDNRLGSLIVNTSAISQ